jgi:hypothetical protein
MEDSESGIRNRYSKEVEARNGYRVIINVELMDVDSDVLHVELIEYKIKKGNELLIYLVEYDSINYQFEAFMRHGRSKCHYHFNIEDDGGELLYFDDESDLKSFLDDPVETVKMRIEYLFPDIEGKISPRCEDMIRKVLSSL